MKKFFAFALVALLLLGACSLSAFAEEGTVAFVAFNGNDSNDGLSAATPKKSWKTFEDVGVMSLSTKDLTPSLHICRRTQE